VNALFFIFALLNTGLLIQMYNGLITSQYIRPLDERPFQNSELLQVLKEGRYSFIFDNHFDPYYQAILNFYIKHYFYNARQKAIGIPMQKFKNRGTK
jgi:hypothetical protein